MFIFARYHTEDNLRPPSNHAIIFDEAQRAWNRAQNMKKFRRDYSEPEMLLRIMERHVDWAVVVALVGGGQEINDGEAGLGEWGRALIGSTKNWIIYASPEVLDGRSIHRRTSIVRRSDEAEGSADQFSVASPNIKSQSSSRPISNMGELRYSTDPPKERPL